MWRIHTCLMHDFYVSTIWHISEGAHMVASNCESLSSITGDFSLSNFTDFFDFCNFSSLHSQRSHKLNKCDWTDVYQNVAKREIKSDWTKFSNFASIADTPDAGLIFLSPISLWNIWKKRHNQILHIPTVFNRYPQDLRLQVKLVFIFWFLSSIRIVFCCKC